MCVRARARFHGLVLELLETLPMYSWHTVKNPCGEKRYVAYGSWEVVSGLSELALCLMGPSMGAAHISIGYSPISWRLSLCTVVFIGRVGIRVFLFFPFPFEVVVPQRVRFEIGFGFPCALFIGVTLPLH